MSNPAVMSALSQKQLVAIVAVDPLGHSATGVTRQSSFVQIDTRYHAGAVHVTPAKGEQWFIKRAGTCWALDYKLPTNTDVLAVVADNPVPGQVQIGSSGAISGPLQLHGSVVSVNAPLQVAAYSTAARPSAAAMGAGAHIFDTTLGKPVWSNGTSWVDSTGTVV